ncbi:MAG: tetratricopeptide repeat protein [Gammaproteobacteria bacterium]|nr:tetratricopeptide repeat protein [Gammaproteobacteria bacterium]
MTTMTLWFTGLLIAALAILLLPLLKGINKETDSNLDTASTPNRTKQSMIAVAVFVPIFTIGLYFTLGTPEFSEIATTKDKPEIETLVQKLEKKLAHKPNDINGWLLLGRSSMMTDDYQKAIFAFEKAIVLEPHNLDALLPLADALAVMQAGKLIGRPYELLLNSIDLEPNNPMALWLIGMAEVEIGDKKKAAEYWKTLYQLLPNDSKDQKQVAKMLAGIGETPPQNSAQKPASVSKSPQVVNGADSEERIQIILDASPSVRTAIEDATVFVYAKSATGMPMPIAAKKYSGSNLPETIILTHKDELIPNRQLADFDNLIIGVKVTSQSKMDQGHILFKTEVPLNSHTKTRIIITY